MPSPSAPWAPLGPTSTTKPSSRQGFADDVQAVQQLWLDGHRERAADRVPVELALKTNLLGTPDMVKERLRRYLAAGFTTLRVGLAPGDDQTRLDALAQLLDIVADLDRELGPDPASGGADVTET